MKLKNVKEYQVHFKEKRKTVRNERGNKREKQKGNSHARVAL